MGVPMSQLALDIDVETVWVPDPKHKWEDATERIAAGYGVAVGNRLTKGWGVATSLKPTETLLVEPSERMKLPHYVLIPRAALAWAVERLQELGMVADEIDWRPTETTPEDYYAQ